MGLEPRTTESQVQHPNHLATRPPSLYYYLFDPSEMERTEKEKPVTYTSSKKDILPTVEFLLFLSGLAINKRLLGSGTLIAELDVTVSHRIVC